MGVLTAELELVQNPALAGVLLWRFCAGYATGSQVQRPTPLPLLFAVLPVVLFADSADLVLATNRTSGLRMFAAKFSDTQNSRADIALSIHDRALKARKLTLNGLRLATAKRLVTIQPDIAGVHSLVATEPSNVPETTRRLMRAANRLGIWCGELTLHEVSAILKVTF